MIELNNSGNPEMSLADASVYIYFIAKCGTISGVSYMYRTTYPSLHAMANSLILLCLARLRSAVPCNSLCHDLVLDLRYVSWLGKIPQARRTSARAFRRLSILWVLILWVLILWVLILWVLIL
jgi:hypothetical protein